MAEGTSGLGRELASEMLAQGTVRGITLLGTKLLGVFTEGSTERFTQQAQRYVFGNDWSDEQAFKLALTRALAKGYITLEERDKYLFAPQKLPKQRQNDYRLYVIQTWDKKADPNVLINRAARTIAHDAKLVVSNHNAWLASLEIFGLDQELPAVFDVVRRNIVLRDHNARLRDVYHGIANFGIIATTAIVLIAVVLSIIFS